MQKLNLVSTEESVPINAHGCPICQHIHARQKKCKDVGLTCPRPKLLWLAAQLLLQGLQGPA